MKTVRTDLVALQEVKYRTKEQNISNTDGIG